MNYEIKYNEKAYKNKMYRIILITFVLTIIKLNYYSSNYEMIENYFKDGTSIYLIRILDLSIWFVLLFLLLSYIRKVYKSSTYNLTGEYKYYTNCYLRFEENYVVIYSENISNKILLKNISNVQIKSNVIYFRYNEQIITFSSLNNREIYEKLMLLV
ncbi:MAG: hypothetical protein ACRC57_07540 [Sarcina sp.]